MRHLTLDFATKRQNLETIWSQKTSISALSQNGEVTLPTAKINKRSVDAFSADGQAQADRWDSEIRRSGLRALSSGLHKILVQNRDDAGIKRRSNMGRDGGIQMESTERK